MIRNSQIEGKQLSPIRVSALWGEGSLQVVTFFTPDYAHGDALRMQFLESLASFPLPKAHSHG
jgi:hypothetical protein